ncbi:MAG: hypothetical protein IPM63_13310 [Acidobacteriota bacterium]|nr:MAG: hypothetical protein IPM63_13310 [Acidobacteriota bacterium]
MIARGVAKLREFAELRQAERVLTGVAPFDRLTGGLIRGGICELTGAEGSGKRGLVLSMIANLTRANNICAVVDASDSFDPPSADRSGVKLDKVLWVKCGGDPKKAVLSTDYLIQSGLFGGIWLDLSLAEKDFLDRLPSSYWFRFKVGLKDTPAVLLVTLEETRLRSASHQSVRVSKEASEWAGDSGFRVMRGAEVRLEMVKPVSMGNEHLSVTNGEG